MVSWIRRIPGGEHRTLPIVVALFLAGRIARYFGIPRGYSHLPLLAGMGTLIAALFRLISRFVKTTPSRQLMLVLDAALFVYARMIGIFFALQGA